MDGKDFAGFLEVKVGTLALLKFAHELFEAAFPDKEYVLPTLAFKVLELAFAENVVIVGDDYEKAGVKTVLFVGEVLHDFFAGGTGDGLTNDGKEDSGVVPGDVEVVLFFPAVFRVKRDVTFVVVDSGEIR